MINHFQALPKIFGIFCEGKAFPILKLNPSLRICSKFSVPTGGVFSTAIPFEALFFETHFCCPYFTIDFRGGQGNLALQIPYKVPENRLVIIHLRDHGK